MTRFLGLGDLHAGAHLGYGRTPQDRLNDQEQTLNRCVDLAIEHEVDAVLLAGDLWDKREPSPAELMAVVRPLRRLKAEPSLAVEILAIPGNHCVRSADSPIALDVLEDIVDIHYHPEIWSPGAPVVPVITLPWAPGVNRLVAARDGGDRDETHDLGAALLLKTAADLRAQIDGPAVLLLHWSIAGASTPTGILTDEFSEVVIPLEGLEQLGFDAIVCSHIHAAQYVGLDETGALGWMRVMDTGPAMNGGVTGPLALYTSSPAPVDFGEADTPHGCWLLDVGDGPTVASFLPIESRAFKTLDIAYTAGAEPMWDAVYDVADAVVRVRYTATEEQALRIDHAEITRALMDAGAHKVRPIEAHVVRATRARVEGVDEEIAPLVAVAAWCESNEVGEGDAGALAELTARYLEEIGAE